MKKIKKLLAMLMAMTMVLGMSVTAFAAKEDGTGTIKVTNLLPGMEVKFYQAVSLKGENGNWTWEVASWAEEKVVPGTPIDTKTLGEIALPDLPTYTATVDSDKTYVERSVAPGAYVIVISDEQDRATYDRMCGTTYNNESVPVDVYGTDTLAAKGEGYTITKTVDGKHTDTVSRGDTVTFTLTTKFPAFDETQTENRTVKIVDTYTGLDSLTVTEVKIGTGPDASVTGYSTDKDEVANTYTIDLSSFAADNTNAGKDVTITYTARVIADNGYTNNVRVMKNGDPITPGPNPDPDPDDPPVVNGYTAAIEFLKFEEGDESKTGLPGAEFSVTKDDSTEKLSFVPVTDDDGNEIPGSYKLYIEGDEGTPITNIKVADNSGIVTIKGLGAGAYKFHEEKAPTGYSLNTADDDVTVTVGDDLTSNVTLDKNDGAEMADSKLASLPSTGGIGTTIFTFGGCALMILAAALYFASRRRTAK